jgi:hypothetical protein
VADLRSDEVHKVGCLGRDAAPVPGFEEFGLEVGRKQTEHATPFSPVLGGQVAKRLVVTKVVGVNAPNAILRCFLLGQHLPGEQGEALTLAGQDTFCRGEPTRGDPSELGPVKDGATDCQGALRYATDMAYRRRNAVRGPWRGRRA